MAKISCILLLAAFGCSTPVISPQSNNTVILIPGLGGDGDVYAKAIYALRDGGSKDCLQVFNWGYGWGLFFISLSSPQVHEETEAKLAKLVMDWRAVHPGCRVALIGHSAGAGVILGMLGRLDDSTEVGPVILLAPAVSPMYDLRAAIAHASVIHVFYSEKDFWWQGLGPTVFGNYDGTYGSGAGRKGFNIAGLTEAEKPKIVLHPYQKEWEKWENDGAHFDTLEPEFVKRVLLPLFEPAARDSVNK